MAQIDINTIQRIEKERNTIHPKVKATYTVFKQGEDTYVQIDTYGKESRASKTPKVSQSFQIDKKMARFLVELLADEFDLTFRIS